MVSTRSPFVVFCLTCIVSSIVSFTVVEIFDIEVCGLDLGRFKVI